MGSIWRHSIQVIAKNSIKIRSFCFGTNLGVAVLLTTEGTGVIVGRLAEGTSVTAISLCGAVQENKIDGTAKANRQSLKVVLIDAYPTCSYRSDTVALIIRPNMKYQLPTVLFHQRDRT